jgi:hypothetical protein
MYTNLDQKTAHLLSKYIDELVRGSSKPDATTYLQECPDKDKEALKRLMNSARLMKAAICDFPTPSEATFEAIWDNAKASYRGKPQKSDRLPSSSTS